MVNNNMMLDNHLM